MGAPKRSAFILGATGAVGQQLMRYLCDSEKFSQIHAPTRKLITIEHKKISHYPFQNFYKPWELEAGVTDFFYCFGSTLKKAGSQEKFKEMELSMAHQALVVAKQTGARRFYLVSARGVEPNSMYFYLKIKSEVEKILKDHLFQGLFIYRPSLILAPREELRVMELIAQKTMWPVRNILQKYTPSISPVSAEQIARAMMTDALSGDEGVFHRENRQIIELSKLVEEIKVKA
jgi:uncharacterized protein YbjT (DUF2867 family)